MIQKRQEIVAVVMIDAGALIQRREEIVSGQDQHVGVVIINTDLAIDKRREDIVS